MGNIMWKYIDETREVLSSIYRKDTKNILKDVTFKIKEINIIGSGSSYNAGLNAQFVYNDILNIKTNVFTPSDYIMNEFINSESLNIFISQTGTSKSVIDALNYATKKKLPTISISSNNQEGIVLLTDHFIDLQCGEENSNAKTKGYSATIFVLLKFLTNVPDELIANQQKIGLLIKELNDVINNISIIKQQTEKLIDEHKNLAAASVVTIIGTNENTGSLHEFSLKLSETMLIPAIYTESVEFSHGLHRTINSNSNIFFLIGEELGKKEALVAYDYFRTVAKNTILINNSSEKYNTNDEIILSGFKYVFSLELAIVIQVFAAYLPEILGNDPNKDIYSDFNKKSKTRI